MEMVMTLEDFHQMVLFQLMDADIPDKYKWIAIDDGGEVYGYINKPNFRPSYNSWGTKDDNPPIYNLDTNQSSELGFKFLGELDMPTHISFKDCVWKL